MPIVIDCLRVLLRFELFGPVLFFFMAGSPFCTSSAYHIGSLSHPAGDRPSHSISVTHSRHAASLRAARGSRRFDAIFSQTLTRGATGPFGATDEGSPTLKQGTSRTW